MTTAPSAPASLRVPMNDLALQHAPIREEMEAALADVVASCGFIRGPQVSAFEEAFASYCSVDHCVGVSNGTDALVLALRALGVGEGDEVITTPHTFGATGEAVRSSSTWRTTICVSIRASWRRPSPSARR